MQTVLSSAAEEFEKEASRALLRSQQTRPGGGGGEEEISFTALQNASQLVEKPQSSSVLSTVYVESVDNGSGTLVTRKVYYLTPDESSRKRRTFTFVCVCVLFGVITTILILCVVFIAPQTPYNLGSTLAGSPARMYPGQRLQNGEWALKLDTVGTLTLYQETETGETVPMWTTDTIGLDVSYAYLNPNGTLQLISSNNAAVWSTPKPAGEIDLQIPVAPYSLNLLSDGTTTITSANNLVVWKKPPGAPGVT